MNKLCTIFTINSSHAKFVMKYIKTMFELIFFKVVLKYNIDFIKTCNLQIFYHIFENEVSLNT
jgi:hypothetical protein